MNQDILNLLAEGKKSITETWIHVQLENEALKETMIMNEELQVQSQELVSAVITTLKNGKFDIEALEYEEVHEIVTGLAITRAKQGFTPFETGMYMFGMREAFARYLEQKLDDAALLYEANRDINKLIDLLSIITFETFIKGREEVILRQTDEMTEISTPVIKVWEGIVALPIIGTLDSARTQVVMENLLQEIVNTGSTIAILDISGVPAVDSLVAQHLMKTVSATRLMGAECIISGIRPEIAQTIVHLGIDLSNISTKASLASALRFAFQQLKLTVVKEDRNNKLT